MSKILIFGNSGSGKSTLAGRFASNLGIQHLDLDSIAWKAEGVRKELAASIVELNAFIDTHDSWIIEGCYGSLIEAAAKAAGELIFLNPGVEACQENCRNRPWEPHKYESREAQEKNLGMLLDWVAEYETRTDEFSLRAHREIFDRFIGRKLEVMSNAEAKTLPVEAEGIEIRPLRPEDCEKIGPLLREIWLDAYHGIQTEEELLTQSHKVHTPDQIADEIDDPNIHSIVAEYRGRLVGHARSDLNVEDGVVDIIRLYVLREFYGQGIGKAMLREVDSWFSPDYEIWLDVFEENERAVKFYQSQGYEIVRRATEVQSEGRDVFEYKMRRRRGDQV